MAFISTLNRFVEVRIPFEHVYVQRPGYHYTSVYLTLRSLWSDDIDPAYFEAARYYTLSDLNISGEQGEGVVLTGDAFCPDVRHLGILNATSRTYRDTMDLRPGLVHPVFGIQSMPFEDLARSSYEPWGRVTIDGLGDLQDFFLGGTLSVWFHPMDFVPIISFIDEDLRRFVTGSGVRTGYLPSVANSTVEENMQWFNLDQLSRVERIALRNILVSILPHDSFVRFREFHIFFDAPWREEVFSDDDESEDGVVPAPVGSRETFPVWGLRDERSDVIREAFVDLIERPPLRPRRLVRSYGDDQLLVCEYWADPLIESIHPPAA
jgi:hypothetical protein